MKMSSESETRDPVKNVVRDYCGFQVFITFLLWIPIFYSYQIQRGLSDADYFEIQSLYYFIFCFLELPTGYIADRWGYRFSMKATAAVMALSNLSAVFWTDYTGFLVHFSLVALSRALMSGAASAYIYEYLKKEDALHLYKKAEGDARFYSLILRIFGWAGVGYMMDLHITIPYWGTVAACLVAWWYAHRLPVLSHLADQRAEVRVSSFRRDLVASLAPIPGILRASKRLFWLMFLGVGIFTLVRLTQVNLYQPILKAKDFAVSSFGWIMSLMTVAEAVGSFQAHRISFWVSDLKAVCLSTVLICVSLAILPLTAGYWMIATLLVFALASGLAFPQLRQLLNDAIPDSRYRATLLSVESIFNRAICGVAALAAGHYVAHGALWGFLIGSAVLTAVLIVGVALRVSYLERPSTVSS